MLPTNNQATESLRKKLSNIEIQIFFSAVLSLSSVDLCGTEF
jgi:hypothetical protein